MHQQQNLSAAHVPAFHRMCLLFQEETALEEARRLSDELGNTILLKREDLQPVHSFKVRGAFNRMSQMTDVQMQKGVICASAGNHAQGVALAALKLVSRLSIFHLLDAVHGCDTKLYMQLPQLMIPVLRPFAALQTPPRITAGQCTHNGTKGMNETWQPHRQPAHVRLMYVSSVS